MGRWFRELMKVLAGGMLLAVALAASLLAQGLGSAEGAALGRNGTGTGPGASVETGVRLFIDSPTQGQVLPSGRLVVLGRAYDSAGAVPGVVVRVNGGPWVNASMAPEDTFVGWRAPVQLGLGHNLIEAKTIDAQGNSAAVSVGVTFDPLPTPPLEVGIALLIAGLISVPAVSVLLWKRFR